MNAFSKSRKRFKICDSVVNFLGVVNFIPSPYIINRGCIDSPKRTLGCSKSEHHAYVLLERLKLEVTLGETLEHQGHIIKDRDDLMA